MDHDDFPLTVDGDISIGPVVAEFCHFGHQLRCGCAHPETAMTRDKLMHVKLTYLQVPK